MADSSAMVEERSKEAGHLMFGTETEYQAGLVGLIGMPTGLTVSQWQDSIKSEHLRWNLYTSTHFLRAHRNPATLTV